MLGSKLAYNKWLLEVNQHRAYEGVFDNYHDIGITKTDLHEAQAPLKPSIRYPVQEDWEGQRNCFENLPANIVYRTFKHTIRLGGLPQSSHR